MVDLFTWLIMAVAFVVILQRIREFGFLEGFRPVWLLALLIVPAWFWVPFRTLRLDPRSVAAIAVLIGFMMQPFGTRGRMILFLSDFALLLLIGSMATSNVAAGNLAPLAPLDLLRDWLLPYLIGRLFFQASGDVDRILPILNWIAVSLAIYAVVEGVLKVNFLDKLLGKTWTEWGQEELGQRWGMKRANGNQSHPIYFGVTLALLLPWTLRSARMGYRGVGRRWWQLTPWLLLAGMVCTGSRSAQLVALCILAADFFYHYRSLRIPLVLSAAVGGLLFATFRDDIVDLLGKYAQEKEGLQKIKINGEFHDYNGTLHRDLLYLVYAEGIEGAGWLGYGTTLEKMPTDPFMEARFKSIDNHYLRFQLQYGWLGVSLFGLLALTGLWNLLPTVRESGPFAGLAAGLLGGMVGTLIVLRGVFFSPDFGWVYLFTVGMGASLERLRRLRV